MIAVLIGLLVSPCEAFCSQAETTQSGYHLQKLIYRGTSVISHSQKDFESQGIGKEPGLEGALPAGPHKSVVNRSYSPRPLSRKGSGAGPALAVPVVPATAVATSNPGLKTSFQGLDLFDQRYANNGNQFNVEPPGQGLAVANGFVLEAVNCVLRVYDTSGKAQANVSDLNTFFLYPPEFLRATPNTYGPFVTEPTCLYDPVHGLWILTVSTLDEDPSTGNDTGLNHLDIAVHKGKSPIGTWNIYSLPAEDDGTQGTPDHGCTNGATTGPCYGAYPKTGSDGKGFFITTNEYSFFGPEYKTAQLYVISLAQLAAGATGPTVFHFDDLSAGGAPAFTMWPAGSANGKQSIDENGTAFFLSAFGTVEQNNTTGFDNRIALWKLENTNSLNTSSPQLFLGNTVFTTQAYGTPPFSDQKTGDVPLGASLGQAEGQLSSNDCRMQQAWYTPSGMLMGALGTIVTVNGADDLAGIALFAFNTKELSVVNQSYLAVDNNNIIYPSVALLPSSGFLPLRGAMCFTLVGPDYFPSAGYIRISNTFNASGQVHVASAGLGPEDGFAEYPPFSSPSWGDYGRALTDGNYVWMASEYIGQTCTESVYLVDESCGNTRTAFGNWATRVSKFQP